MWAVNALSAAQFAAMIVVFSREPASWCLSAGGKEFLSFFENCD
jgi:hypothetical protein